MNELGALFDRDQEALRCPYPIFDGLRADAPVVYDDGLGAWVATGYVAARTILRDTENWSSLSPTSPGPRESAMTTAMATLSQEPAMAEAFEKMLSGRRTAAVLLNADPPEHVRQRRVVNAAFRPARIRELEPRVLQRSDELVAAFAGRGTVEFVSEYAVLLPMRIIADALGVGDDDLLMFKQWSDDLVIPIGNAAPSVDQVRDFITSTQAFSDYFSDKLEQRARKPQNDLVSDVANAELDGERLTHAEQISMCQQFLVAGNETTTKLIANMANRFATDPGLQQSIDADRSLIPSFVEEALRFEAPVQGLYRQAKHDVTIGGVTVPAGITCGSSTPRGTAMPTSSSARTTSTLRGPMPANTCRSATGSTSASGPAWPEPRRTWQSSRCSTTCRTCGTQHDTRRRTRTASSCAA